MEILARFTHSVVNHTQDNEVPLVITLKAPTLDWVTKRPRLCVIPVIDLSGSMRGPKLEYAKQSLLKLVDQLAEGDFTGLVGFEDRAHVFMEPGQVTAEFKDQMKRAIRDLGVMGGTNLAEGFLQAAQLIRKLDLPDSFLKRVILFTDGQPTTGITSTDALLTLVEANREFATFSAFGYGTVGGDVWGGCDQDFLTEFASLGRGNYAYVQDPDDALGAFGKELGGLLSTYATDLRLEIEPVKGHQIESVITNTKYEEDVTGLVEIPLADILSEEARHFVLQTKLLKQAKAFPRDTTAFDVTLTYSLLTEQGSKEVKTLETKARIRFGREEDKVDSQLEEIVALHMVIRAQLQAEEAAKKGLFANARNIMSEVAGSIEKNGYANLAALATEVGHRMDATSYTSSTGFLRSISTAGTRAYGTSRLDGAAEEALTNCNVSLDNGAMRHYTSSFTTGKSE